MKTSIDDEITSTLQVVSTLLIFIFAYVSYVLGRYQMLKADLSDPVSVADALKPHRDCRILLAGALVPIVPIIALLTPRLADVLANWSWPDPVRTGFFLVYMSVFALMVAVGVLDTKIRITIGRLREQLAPHASALEEL